MVTVREVLDLPVLRGARVVAGHKALHAPVRWCHISEVTDIARLLSGGELLLTTGIALDLPPEQHTAYVESLRERGVSGLLLELDRKFTAAPQAMVEAANRVGLPLITLPFDTPFVQVTQEIHKLILSREALGAAERAGHAERELLSDLAAGRVPDLDALKQRLQALGRRLPDQVWMAFLAAESGSLPEAVRSGAAADLGKETWVTATVGSEVHLVAFSADRSQLARALRTLAGRLAPFPAGAGRCVPLPAALPASLAEARQTMLLRRINSGLSPLFEETGVYQLALGRSSGELQAYVDAWLGPLLQYDRTRRSNHCQTLRFLLDSRHTVSEAAQGLHLTRQGLYLRLNRINEVLGHNLDDAEVRLALSMAFRFHDLLVAAARS